MSSSSNEKVTDETTNVAIDRRAVMEQGTQILDSIIMDDSPESIKELMRGLEATWQTGVRGNSLNLMEIMDLGDEVLKMATKSQIGLDSAAHAALKNGMDQFEMMIRQGNMVVDLSDDLAERSMDLADDTTSNALDIISEVKTADFSDSLKSLSFAIMAFALGAIYLTTRNN